MPSTKYGPSALSALQRYRSADDPAITEARLNLREAKLAEEIAAKPKPTRP